MRSLLQRGALALAAIIGLLGSRPATANAQKALVYCPVSIDATGCNAIVAALTGPAYPLGVDRGYDGTDGTVDLKAVDLFSYSVFVVPSLADDSTSQPYAKLRDPEVAEHLKAALIGRIAMWSGTPDQGATNRTMKDALIQNLAAWSGGAFGTAKGPGLVALLDMSASVVARYDWVRAITPVPVTSDANLLIYSSVRSLDPIATTILTSGSGTIAYANMATFGFQVPNGAAGVSLDAVGQTGTSQGGQVVLLTMEAGNSSGAVVKTDKDDYAPGTTVIITGSGWAPNETVALTLHHDPMRANDTELTAVADANGAFTNTNFAPADYDVDVRFVMTAIGQASGRRAQTTFTDAQPQTVAVTGQAPNPVLAGGSAAYSVTVAFNGNATACTVTLSAAVSASPAWPTPPAGGFFTFGSSSVTGSTSATTTLTVGVPAGTAPNTYQFIVTATKTANCQGTVGATTPSSPINLVVGANPVTTTTVTTTGSPSIYGNSVTLTASVKAGATAVTAGTVTFIEGGSCTSPGTVVGGPTALDASGNAALSTATLAASATAHTIVACYSGAPGFNPSNGSVNQKVDARQVTVTADAKAKGYGDADPTLTYQLTSGSLASGDAFSGGLARVAGENVGTYAIQKGSLTLSANYVVTYVGASLTITTRSVTVTADPKTKVYGDVEPTLTYQITSGSLAFADAFSGALTRVAGNNVGTFAIQQGTLALNANYVLTYIGANLTITGRPLTVTADAKSKGYGDADPAFTYQITSGSLASGDALTGALTRVTGENVGTYGIQQGALTASANYTLVFIPANLTITTRAIAVTADAQTKIYGDVEPALTYKVTSGSLVTGDTFSGSLTRATGETVGSYAISQGTLSAGGNYALSFTGANLTITTRAVTVTADAKTKGYGDPDPTLTYAITTGSLAFTDAFTGALARATGENVGTHAITQGTLALNSNYVLTFVGANLTITTRAIAVKADAKTKVYGNADPALTYQITSGSLAFSDAFNGALSRVAGEAVGTYAIGQGTLALSSNYNLSFVGADLSITQRPITVTADAKTKVYGDNDPALTYQLTTGTLVSGDALTGTPTRVAGEPVGTYAIQQGNVTAGPNYLITFVPANFSITRRPITVTADAKSKTYGEADPTLTHQVTSGNLVFGDTFAGSLTRVAGENVGMYAINKGTLSAGANYELTFVGANLTISVRPVTVTADAKTKVYGIVDPALTYQITSGSLAFTDAFSGALDRLPGENVGSYAIQQGTLALSSNYALTYAGANLTITPRPITVTADSKTKVYGDVDPTLTYQITSGSLAFEDQFGGSISRDPGENVGSYAIKQGTLALSTNYELTYIGANLGITQRPLAVAADAKSKTYGDADPAFTYHITSGTFAFSDGFTGSLERGAGEDVGTYPIQVGTLTAGANYLLTYAGADLTINKRSVGVTADTKTKVYGNADPALTYQISSGSLAFSDAFSGALSRLAGENVGTYAIVQGTLALSSNYNLSFTGANLSITTRAVTITADPKTKVYGDPDPTLTYQITYGSLAFSDAFSGSLTRVVGESVGNYGINQGTVALSANYVLSYIGANLTISKRTLNVTADDKSKIAGAVNPTLTGTVVGVQFSDNITATYSTTAVTLSTPGTYSIVPATVDPNYKIGNYDVHLYNGTLTVTPNAKPVLGAFTGPLLPVALGTSINISIPFTDVDVAASQPYTATINWGDASNSTSAFTAPGTITGTKNYAAAGVYNVTVTVKQDNFPTTHYDTKTYEYYVVVYDPNGGFVTGGGWIDSPAGAYYADPSLTGKANFGFVAKYKKGQTTPDGNTEFQYQAGNLNFKAASFDWLVIAGSKAQFKGSGTINGSGDYGFMLTAIDGELKGKSQDTFRMRIWSRATNAVVYDNLLNAPDSTDPSTALGGGSIQIHDK